MQLAKLRQLVSARKKEEIALPSEAKTKVVLKASLFNRAAATMTDIERILNLPLDFPLDDEEKEAFNATYLRADAFARGDRFLPAQPNGIIQYLLYGGAVLPIGVGHGKTVIGTVIADLAFKKTESRILLCMPPGLVPQYRTADIAFIRSLCPLDAPIHFLSGKARGHRKQLTRRASRGIYVFPWSLFSSPDAEELLHDIDPCLIVADEAHYAARHDAARTRRLSRYLSEREAAGNPVQVVAMSGTLTNKNLAEYAHIARWALRDKCFLPTSGTELAEWGSVIDAQVEYQPGQFGSGSARDNSSSIMKLIPWARAVTGEQFEYTSTDARRAFQVRMKTAPGVFSTGDASVGTTLIMHNEPVPEKACTKAPGWDDLQQLITQVEDAWIAPSGDQIDFALHKHKWMQELSAGFYNDLRWPEPAVLAERRAIPEPEAAELLERAQEHHFLGQEYHKALRKFLQTAPKGMDTPMLVGQEFHNHEDSNLPSPLYRLWKAWKDADFEGRPDRDSIPVRVCPYKVDHALRFAATLPKGVGSLYWYVNTEMGVWLLEAFRAAGKDAVLCGAGQEANDFLAKVSAEKDNSKHIILSANAHKEGKNLQHMQHQLFVQWTRPAKYAEQVLGRQHRNGQQADEITATTCFTSPWDRMTFAATLNDALYIQQSLGTPQKLIYANYDPMPSVMDHRILEERGFDPIALDPAAIRLRQAKFGA